MASTAREPAPPSAATRLAWALCVLSIALAVASVALALFNGENLPELIAYHHAIGILNRLVNRTLVYGLLTVLLGAVYAGLVLALGQLSGGGGRAPSWAVAGATLAVAALFQPARRRVQQVVDLRFNRRKYDAARTIELFNARLRDQVDLDTLSAELLATVDQTMRPAAASLWLRPSAADRAPGKRGPVGSRGGP